MITTKNIPKTSGIYKFTNKINNKVYIGQAKNLKQRIQQHLYDFDKNNYKSYLYSGIQKHGIENFEVELIFEGSFSKDELNQMEINLIKLFKSTNILFGYNLTEGGGGSSGYKHTEEHKQRVSEIHKGRIVSEQTKEKMSKSGKGKIITEEHLEKIKQTKIKNGTWCKGFKHDEDALNKIRETKIKNGTLHKTPWNKGVKVSSEETLKKLSDSLKGRIPWSKGKKMKQESIDKMVATKIKNGTTGKGKKLSQEEKDKMNAKSKATKEFNKNMKLIKENNFIYDWLF